MPVSRTTAVALFLIFSSGLAFGCSCSNNTPIQKTNERYRDRAVFTAHVVQLMGRVYNWDGKRLSSQVLAVVKDRYWGLPWYWPKVVMLDGSYPCDIAMEEGQDYLVSGRRERYGVLDVAVCSRTQPLKTAQVDLRTLDGSYCAGPGGTVIGRVSKGQDDFHDNPVVPNVPLTFRDQDDKAYSTRSDKDGIYELQHLAAGMYTLDSHLGQTQYLAGGFTVENGMCSEADVLLKGYDISGRLLPGLGYHVTVELVGVNSSQVWERGDLQDDGKFYFKNAPDGEYLVAVASSLQGQGNDLYYPGTYDRRKAMRIKITNHRIVGPNEFNFKPELLPFVPIPVALDPPNDSGKFYWRILLTTPNNIIEEERWAPGIKFVLLYGLRGQSYGVRLSGDPNYRTVDRWCGSEDLPITARPGLPLLRISVPVACR